MVRRSSNRAGGQLPGGQAASLSGIRGAPTVVGAVCHLECAIPDAQGNGTEEHPCSSAAPPHAAHIGSTFRATGAAGGCWLVSAAPRASLPQSAQPHQRPAAAGGSARCAVRGALQSHTPSAALCCGADGSHTLTVGCAHDQARHESLADAGCLWRIQLLVIPAQQAQQGAAGAAGRIRQGGGRGENHTPLACTERWRKPARQAARRALVLALAASAPTWQQR